MLYHPDPHEVKVTETIYLEAKRDSDELRGPAKALITAMRHRSQDIIFAFSCKMGSFLPKFQKPKKMGHISVDRYVDMQRINLI